MNKTWKNARYLTTIASSDESGWTALELTMRVATNVPELIARVVFWDADGEFFS